MKIVKTGVRDDSGFPVLKKEGEPEPVVLPDGDPAAVRAGYEPARFSLEAASGGKNTLLFDDLGLREIPPQDVISAPGILYRG